MDPRNEFRLLHKSELTTAMLTDLGQGGFGILFDPDMLIFRRTVPTRQEAPPSAAPSENEGDA